jgi:hypothetical protein
MKHTMKIAALLLASTLPFSAVPASAAGSDSWYSSMEGVPEAVVNTAKKAKPGIVLKKSRLTWRTDEGVYIVVGRYYGTPWRFNITRSGELLSMVEVDK